MSEFDRDLDATLRGRLAGGTLNIVEETLNILNRRVDQRVMVLLGSGKGLTPEQAMQAWYEKFAVEALRTKLEQLSEGGKSAAQRLTPKMEIGNGPQKVHPAYTPGPRPDEYVPADRRALHDATRPAD